MMNLKGKIVSVLESGELVYLMEIIFLLSRK